MSKSPADEERKRRLQAMGMDPGTKFTPYDGSPSSPPKRKSMSGDEAKRWKRIGQKAPRENGYLLDEPASLRALEEAERQHAERVPEHVLSAAAASRLLTNLDRRFDRSARACPVRFSLRGRAHRR